MERGIGALLVLLSFVACSDDGDKSSGPADETPKCVVNSTATCACPDGLEGVQTCQADGTYSSCDCPCSPGFEPTAEGCVDIDECATDMHTCHPEATCVNLYGDYHCRCSGFYFGDGEQCDLDECLAGADDCDPVAICTNSEPGYSCTCPAGFSGSGTTCTDTDECAISTHTCGSHASCTNLPGTYSCSCLDGYRLDATTCVNIDECAEEIDTCADAPGVICIDTNPGFTCACDEGYMGDGVICTPDANSAVRDISDRPILFELQAVGTLSVAGLSRVGWDVEVIESPTLPNCTHKDPGLVTIPDITLRELTGTATEIDALIAWAEQGASATTKSASLLFLGLSGEAARLNLLGFLPVAVDPTTTANDTDVTLSELVIRLPDPNVTRTVAMELAEWRAPASGPDLYPPCGVPGHAIQIAGVEAYPCYPLGVLTVPTVDTSESLYLPGVRNAHTMYDWAMFTTEGWLDIPTNGIERRSLSVVDCEPPTSGPDTACDPGVENGRINLFEAFPARFDFFDPLRPYGYEYLFHMLVVHDYAEQA